MKCPTCGGDLPQEYPGQEVVCASCTWRNRFDRGSAYQKEQEPANMDAIKKGLTEKLIERLMNRS